MNELLLKNTMHQGKHCDQVEIQVDQTVTLMVSDLKVLWLDIVGLFQVGQQHNQNTTIEWG